MKFVSPTGLLLAVAGGVAAVSLVAVLGGGNARTHAKSTKNACAVKANGRIAEPRREIRISNPRGSVSGRLPSVNLDAESVASREKEDDVSVDELTDRVVDELLASLKSLSDGKNRKMLVDMVKRLLKLNALNGELLAKFGDADKLLILGAINDAGVPAAGLALDLMGNANAEVNLSATELLFNSLNDLSLGDYRRADIVVSAASKIEDRQTIDRLYQEFIKLRPSLCVSVSGQINEVGTDAAKEVLPRAIKGFTGEVAVTTPEAAAEWLEDNREDPEIADWFYGPKGTSALSK